jgi:hypothetical protein
MNGMKKMMNIMMMSSKHHFLKKNLIFIVFQTTFLSVGLLPSWAQSPSVYFGGKYAEAITFVKKNKSLWVEHFGKKDASKMIAIVFPEILRYNAALEEAETQLLKSLYVRFGNQYADFSIGYFQMKPSFAEKIEEMKGIALQHTSQERFERVGRIKSMQGQIEYLKDFATLVYLRFPELSQKTEKEQVSFLASAYNLGFWFSKAAIENWIGKKAFPSGKNAAIKFAYTDIAVEFFIFEAPKIFQNE